MRVHVVRATHNGRKNQITLFVKIKKKPSKYNVTLKKDIIHNYW